MACGVFAGKIKCQKNRERSDDTSEEKRRPEMRAGVDELTFPTCRRKPERGGDACQPLRNHQPGEEPVGAPADHLLIFGEGGFSFERDLILLGSSHGREAGTETAGKE